MHTDFHKAETVFNLKNAAAQCGIQATAPNIQ